MSTEDVDSKTQQGNEELINSVIDSLFYQDSLRKPLTNGLLEEINATKKLLREADSLFLDGLCPPDLSDAFIYLSEAETKGCNHPLLYYFLGLCHQFQSKDTPKAIQYYEKAVAGES